MKKLLLLPLILVGLWSAYWWMGKSAMLNALADARADLAKDGITLMAPDVKIAGYPLHYRATLTDMRLEGPKGSFTPQIINITAEALRPTVWTLSADKTARISLRGNQGQNWVFDLDGDEMRVELGSSVSGKLKSVKADFTNLRAVPVSGGPPPILALGSGKIDLSPSLPPLTDGLRANFDISGITLAPGAGGKLQQAFGDTITRINGSGIAPGLASLDNKDMAAWQTAGAVTVPDFNMSWGEVGFIGNVDLQMGESGANGAAALGVNDADALLSAFVSGGLLSQNQALAGQFLLMAAPRDDAGRIVLTFPVEDNALTLLGQTLHTF
jgi:hypothetical protein